MNRRDQHEKHRTGDVERSGLLRHRLRFVQQNLIDDVPTEERLKNLQHSDTHGDR